MQIRVVRLNSRNPLVGIFFLVVILAILAFVLTAGMALLAGGAILGTVGYLARRVFGGKSIGAASMEGERVVVMGDEVFPSAQLAEDKRLASIPEVPVVRVETME